MAEDFFAALLRFGTWEGYDFFAVKSRRRPAELRLADLRARGARVREFSDFNGQSDGPGMSAWHGISLDGGVIPLELRRRFPSEVRPITLVHHTISYPNLLHREFLPLLLADIRSCDSIICPSSASRRTTEILLDAVAERFNHRYRTNLRFAGRLDTIPLGVDTEALRPSDQVNARRQLMLPEEPLILLWLGRISAIDKADLGPLVNAFADVRQYAQVLGGPEARPLMLVIAGGDPFDQAGLLERQAQRLGVADSVRIHTYVDAFRKGLYYAAADIFVAPTDNIQETYGLTPVEAMACGLPQVVADWDGYRDTVSHEETGMLVPTLWTDCDSDLLDDPQSWQDRTDHASLAQSVALDPTKLRSALLALINNDDLRLRMREASRKRAEALYAWPRVIEEHEQLWGELRTIAAGLEARSYPEPNYDRPLFFDAFRHYATNILEDEQRIFRSTAGAAALEQGGELAPYYGDMDPRTLRLALERLDDTGTTLGKLVAELRAAVEGSPSEAHLRRHVMRLLKYGYAQIP